ncbi:surface protein Lk90-like protein [Vibrio sp. JCM 19236]|nr:surface protein Lk90-like protein [Vibrio sp. JCM 19236]
MSGLYLHEMGQRGMRLKAKGGGITPPPVTVTAVAINEILGSLTVGDTAALTTTVTYSNGATSDSGDMPSIISWSSTDGAVIAIDSNGSLEALSVGSASLTATSSENNSISDSIDVSVESTPATVASISISVSSTDVSVGDSGEFIATVGYSDGSEKVSTERPEIVDWSSSNDAVMTVGESGEFSALSEGAATITTTSTEDDEFFDSVEMTVSAVVTVTGVSIDQELSLLNEGDTGTLTATVTYSDAITENSADTPSIVSWVSDNETAVSIDNFGAYEALTSGTATITATSAESGSVSDLVTVTVKSEPE